MSKKEKKHKISRAGKAFQVVATILFAFLIFFVIIDVATTKKGIMKLTNDYVLDVTIDPVYFDSYIEAGFTEEMCYKLFESNEFREVIAAVMYDRVAALFHDTEIFEHDKSYCDAIIENKIREICEEYQITLTNAKIDTLTMYTSDISGISAMFIYNTPELYRTSVFDATDEDIGEYTGFFSLIAILTSPVFPITIFIMYLVCILALIFICVKDEKNDLFVLICDTIILPSFVCVGISVGELFGIKNEAVIMKYLFTISLVTGIICAVIGIIAGIIIRKITREKGV